MTCCNFYRVEINVVVVVASQSEREVAKNFHYFKHKQPSTDKSQINKLK